jgi:osmotically-inducible protein OsmY
MTPRTIRLSLAAAAVTLFLTTVPAGAQPPATKDVTADLAAAGVVIDGLRAVDVGGIVVLRGKAADKAAAENASSVATTLGFTRVANLITVVEAPDDAALARAAERQLSARGLDGSHIAVGASNGVLHLTGRVAYELQKDMAVQLVRNLDGVRGVQTDLQR